MELLSALEVRFFTKRGAAALWDWANNVCLLEPERMTKTLRVIAGKSINGELKAVFAKGSHPTSGTSQEGTVRSNKSCTWVGTCQQSECMNMDETIKERQNRVDDPVYHSLPFKHILFYNCERLQKNKVIKKKGGVNIVGCKDITLLLKVFMVC